MGYEWVIGVLLASVASFISNTGLNIQKLNHIRNEEEYQRLRCEALQKQAGKQSSDSLPGSEHVSHKSVSDGDSSGHQGDGDADDYSLENLKISDLHSGMDPRLSDSRRNSKKYKRIHRVSFSLEKDSVDFDGDHDDTFIRMPFMSPDIVDERKPVNYCKQKLWLIGLSLVIVGSVCDFVALAFAAQSVVAPLGSLTLVSNIWLAQLLLQEEISRREIFATLGIVTGSGIAVAFASHENVDYTISELFNLYSKQRFFIYAFAVIVSIIAMFAAVKHIEAVFRKCSHGERPRRDYDVLIRYHRFLYPAMAGTAGAQSVLFAKTTAELVVVSIKGDGNLFASPLTYAVLLGLGVSIYFQIRWLNAGLMLFDAVYTVPVFQTFWILVSVTGGLVFFNEYKQVFLSQDSFARTVGFPTGIFLTIAGVYYLSQRSPRDASSDDNKMPMLNVCSGASPGDLNSSLLDDRSAGSNSCSDIPCTPPVRKTSWTPIVVHTPIGHSFMAPSFDAQKFVL